MYEALGTGRHVTVSPKDQGSRPEGRLDWREKRLDHLFLTSDEAVFSLRGNKAKDDASAGSRQLLPSPVSTTNAVLRMRLRNANPAAKCYPAVILPEQQLN